MRVDIRPFQLMRLLTPVCRLRVASNPCSPTSGVLQCIIGVLGCCQLAGSFPEGVQRGGSVDVVRVLHLRGGGIRRATSFVIDKVDEVGGVDNRDFGTLVIIRHGMSVWNRENRFTGWEDVPLAREGERDARRAGRLCRMADLKFDLTLTSVLERAIVTTEIIRDEGVTMRGSIQKLWQLNERHDGAMTGKNKKLAALEYGQERLQHWRRSYADAPPPVKKDHPYWPGNHQKYRSMPDIGEDDFPCTESLHDVLLRVLPTWDNTVAPALRQGKTVLMVTHGNVVRVLAKMLDELSEEAIETLDMPACCPLVYKLSRQTLKPVLLPHSWPPLRALFLGDQDRVRDKIACVQAETMKPLFARDIRQESIS